MTHSGRHRMKTHAGLPQGSTCNLSTVLQIYYQFNTRESGLLWIDASSNGNNAAQGTTDNQPTGVTGGGLDFEDTNDAANASMMDFTSFNIGADTDFLMFIVWHPETTATNCYLSDSGAEIFQIINGNRQLFKTPVGGASDINHSAAFTIDAGEKSVLMIHRTNGATGTIKLYKNGLVFDPSVTDPNTFDLQNLGSKNDTSNWFDGIIYDVGVIEGSRATDKVRQMIGDYLMCKHGLERLGNN